MKLEDLAERLPPGGLFRTGAVLAGQSNPASLRRQLDRWTKRGRMVQLRRGVYVLRKPFAANEVHPFCAANAVKKASYVSMHSALAHYGMIPEYVPVTTGVTTGRPEQLATPLGRFEFRHLAATRFFGFVEKEIAPEQIALVATPQKALLDLFYLTPGSEEVDFIRELRLERPEGFDLGVLQAMAEQMESVKVARAVRQLLRLWEEEK